MHVENFEFFSKLPECDFIFWHFHSRFCIYSKKLLKYSSLISEFSSKRFYEYFFKILFRNIGQMKDFKFLKSCRYYPITSKLQFAAAYANLHRPNSHFMVQRCNLKRNWNIWEQFKQIFTQTTILSPIQQISNPIAFTQENQIIYKFNLESWKWWSFRF